MPFFKRYFLGGSTTLRGWGRYEVSPLREGQVIGGLGFFEIDGRAPLPDPGRASRASSSARAARSPNARGTTTCCTCAPTSALGLRYATPIGPIRADVGYQLNPVPGLLIAGEEQARRWRIHVSVGQAF